MLAAIDLHGANRTRLADPDTIRRFVPEVIDTIGMRAHGPLMLERFGVGALAGSSALRFIETRSLAAEVAVAHFGGASNLTLLER